MNAMLKIWCTMETISNTVNLISNSGMVYFGKHFKIDYVMVSYDKDIKHRYHELWVMTKISNTDIMNYENEWIYLILPWKWFHSSHLAAPCIFPACWSYMDLSEVLKLLQHNIICVRMSSSAPSHFIKTANVHHFL